MRRLIFTVVALLLLPGALKAGNLDTLHCPPELSIQEFADQVLTSLVDSGYCAAQVEIVPVRDAEKLLVRRGDLFTVSQLKLRGVADSLLAQVVLVQQRNLPLTRSLREAALERIVRLSAEAGYPFAQLTVNSEVFEHDTLYLDCRLLPGPRVRIGAVRYEGLEVTRPATLTQRHELRLGDWYRESRMRDAGERLRQIDFCTLKDEPQLRFNSRDDAVEIIFPMQDRRSVRFDGGLLLLPDRSAAGNLELSLHNLLGAGRRFGMSWDRKDADSRRLQVDFAWPYVAGVPFDLEVQLSQEERDSAFVSTAAAASLSYHAGSSWLTGAGITWQKTTPPENEKTPSARSYGLELTTAYDIRDDRRDPRAGAWLQFGFASRYRKSFDLGDSLTGGYGSTIRADLQHWLRLGANSSAYNRLQLFQVNSDFDPLPLEELLPVGGNSGLRGYRERQFLADAGIIHTLELHWHPLPRLLLRIFVDNAYLSIPAADFGLTGFGSGFSVDTDLGKIRFDLSLGEEKSLDKLLVHFGFESEW